MKKAAMKALAKDLSIVGFGQPVLRQKSRPLSLPQIHSQTIKKLIPRMFYTMRNIGVGLAAPQIGLPLCLAVIEVKPLPHRPKVDNFPKTVIINPVIRQYSKKKLPMWEGCLSLPGVAGQALRSDWVVVEYLDEQGNKHKQKHTGFVAEVFQHEIDHLNGILYVDRIKDIKTLVATSHSE